MIDKVIAETLAREALADAPRGAGRRKMPTNFRTFDGVVAP
jgi:hypothetical protein